MENTVLRVSKPHASDQDASYRLNQIQAFRNYCGCGVENPYSYRKVVNNLKSWHGQYFDPTN